MFRDALGCHGIYNHNMKGKDLLFLLKSNKHWVLLTYFICSNYTTWWSFNPDKWLHMLDNCVWSQMLFFQVKDWIVVNCVIHSYNKAEQKTSRVTSIKSKLTGKSAAKHYWKLIGYHESSNELFNDNFSKSVNDDPNDSEFNTSTLEAGVDTATKNEQKNKGWFNFSPDSLLLLIDTRDALLSDYQTLGIGKVYYSLTNQLLNLSQLALNYAITLVK